MPKHNTAVQGLVGWIRARLDGRVRRLLRPARESVVLATVLDLSRSKADLVAENALLHQVKRPLLTSADRFGLLLLAKWVWSWW